MAMTPEQKRERRREVILNTLSDTDVAAAIRSQ